jgi:hypothetical protein
VGFSDQAADPTTAGNLQRRGADLKWHDGTAVRTVVSTDATQTLSNKTLTGTTRVGFADQATDPAAAGDFQRRGADLKWHDGTAVRTVVSTDATQTLSNKTLTGATLTGTGRVGFADQGADPTTAGTLQRNAGRLKWHTGTTVEALAYVSEIPTGAGAFPAGTRLVFDQDTPPAGWTRDTTINDRVVRIVGGARTHGGSWTISGLTSPAHQHDMGNHTHSAAAHSHTLSGGAAIAYDQDTPTAIVSGEIHSLVVGTTFSAPKALASTNAVAITTGGPSTNLTSSVAVTISSDGSWRPLSRDMIVASKD